jgi:hypothetical protein
MVARLWRSGPFGIVFALPTAPSATTEEQPLMMQRREFLGHMARTAIAAIS